MNEERRKELLEKHPYLRFWSETLDKLPFDIKYGMFHRKNLKCSIWIIFFNPISAFFLSILLLFILLFLMTN